jgi:hypothetical protein
MARKLIAIVFGILINCELSNGVFPNGPDGN